MATSKIGLNIWLGSITVLWSLQPLLLSHARGAVILSLLTALLAMLGWLIGVVPLVIWSGALGLCNLTLALMMASHPPSLWTGLGAGITLLALVDGCHRFTYLKRCWLAPGALAALLGTFVRISGLTLAMGMALGLLVIALGHQPVAASATGLVTIAGVCLFVGFLALFLFYTSR
ncbi:hypothetical protein NKDENANG_01369 [Candidatus Entotheonellaceae bacterium PAL068K]